MLPEPIANRRAFLSHPLAAATSVLRKHLSRWAPGMAAGALSWSLAISITSQLVTFSMSVLLARVIGRLAFGEWAALQNTVGTISGIAQLSMAVTATKFVAALSRTEPERVGRILGLCSSVTLATGTLAAGSVALSAPWFSSVVLHAPHLSSGLRISAVSMLLLTINGFQVGALAGLGRFKALAILGALGGVTTATCVIGLALAWGLEGALSGYALAAAITWSGYHFVLRSECRRAGIAPRYRQLRKEISVLAHFAIPATLAGVAGMLSTWSSMVLVVRRSEGYSQMAALSAAATLRGAVLFAPVVITRVSAPVLAGLAETGALERHKHTLRGSAALAAASAAAVAVPVALGAPWLLGLFGRSFRGSAAVVVVMVAGGVVEAAAQALNQQFLSRGRMWWNLAMVTGRGLILVGLTYLLIPGGAALGAAWAMLLSHGAALAFAFAFMVRTEASLVRD